MAIIKQYFLLVILLFLRQGDLHTQTITQRNIDSLSTVLRTAKEDTVKVNILNNLCRQFHDAGNYEKARNFADSALELADKLNFKMGKANVYLSISRIYHSQGDYTAALKSLPISLTIYEEIGDKLGMAYSYLGFGNVYESMGNYSEALKNCLRSLRISLENGFKKPAAGAYNHMGIVFSEQGNYTEAMKNQLAALKIQKELGDNQGAAMSYESIGIIYAEQQNYPEALNNFLASLKIMDEIGEKRGISASYSNIAIVYENQGNYIEAKKYHFASLKIDEEIGNEQGVADSYNNIGILCLKEGNYIDAVKYETLALKYSEKAGEKDGVVSALLNLGEIFSAQAAKATPSLAKKKYFEAIGYFKKGLSLAKEIELKGFIRNAYKGLSGAYKGLLDYKKSLEYNDLYIEMKDSLVNNEMTVKLEQQRTQYEVEVAVAEEKIKSETVLAEQKAENKRKNELLLAGLSILAIISFFIALLIRQRNQKRRAIEKAETGHKMAELELQSLRAQLNPHFMFNSLNAIQDLILKEDNDRSHLYLSRFSKLLRMLLDNANQPFVSVKQEMEFLELYLSLENLRIPDLQFSIEKDPKLNAEERMIPNMMLQPYVENAIWHGLSNKKGERKLQIRIHENGTATEFEIEDNGIGRKKAAEIKSLYRIGHTSKGMELLSKRFNLLSKEYGEAIQTRVTDMEDNGEATGTLVKISVPFSLSEQAKKLIHDTNHNN